VGQGGDVLVRINPQSFPLQEKAGGSFDLLSHLQELKKAVWMRQMQRYEGVCGGRCFE
jgi:hypothetical protein